MVASTITNGIWKVGTQLWNIRIPPKEMLGPPFPSALCWCWCIWWTFAEEYKNKDCAIYPIGGYNEYYKKSIKKSSEDLGLIKLSPTWATASIDEIDSWKIEEIRNFGIKYLHRSCDAWLLYQPSGPGFDSWHVSFWVSYYKGENPNDAAATYLICVMPDYSAQAQLLILNLYLSPKMLIIREWCILYLIYHTYILTKKITISVTNTFVCFNDIVGINTPSPTTQFV